MNIALAGLLIGLVSINVYSWKVKENVAKNDCKHPLRTSSMDGVDLDERTAVKSYMIYEQGQCIKADKHELDLFVDKILELPDDQAKNLLAEFRRCQVETELNEQVKTTLRSIQKVSSKARCSLAGL